MVLGRFAEIAGPFKLKSRKAGKRGVKVLSDQKYFRSQWAQNGYMCTIFREVGQLKHEEGGNRHFFWSV